MKKISILFTICCIIALASCQKKNAPLFRGDYSFKTSGSVTLEEIMFEDDTIETASYTVSLPNEKAKIGRASCRERV